MALCSIQKILNVSDCSGAAAEASKEAIAASKNAALVLRIHTDIIQKWQGVIAKMKPAAACVGDAIALPACTASCQLHLTPCAKGKGSKGQCTYAIRDLNASSLTAYSA